MDTFSNRIGRNLELDIDDVIIKTSKEDDNYGNLEDI